MDTPRVRQRADFGRWWHAGWLIAAAALLVFPDLALAHQAGAAGGLASGFAHPILGADHLVAMVAVGLWGAFLGQPAIWLLPVVFPFVMALGALLGINGVALPAVEMSIAGSALAFGAVVALALRPPLWLAAVLVGAFALFHGHAHGTELPQAVNPLAYGVGFVVATGLLHLSGITLGLLARWPAGVRVVRFAGIAIACAGLYFLSGA
ncbi:MAG TPA: HupE/UreJ family protein [Geminicoccaceae bacterium]|nr:HupE/UreJ family protein [Geminicoccaceae bacterium]